ncbi:MULTISPECIES: shikimate kinase [unclassified Staphylococcus]|uniref:shikimate kinase n=1 Tax=unclassified Staphylococcus TaxID=91994 RepID=UPI0021CF7623|nr:MULTISPECIES: shikimate kinase [unclassified Staphylococcus]UXR68679.1 shikimate kinase [Staphylococcus sp. IVB6246]UXR72967.1 shikimate kinase [Staphylococcus sp. IVB6238]UXR75262.1 shikimate kinase [Staphylococcus sp. IVB6233]UXR79463.1 shikimate kinase [Staphylococcus sp. IVB6218]
MNRLKRPIILVGFMGSGKSSIGKALAKRHNYRFIDLDQHIASSEKMSIPDIFKHDGETTFRLYEQKYLKETLHKYDIISTGGGIITNDETFQFLKTLNAEIIWLDAPFSILYQRVKGDPNRPNAKNSNYETLKNLYLSRVSRYNEIAFMKVTTKNTMDETLHEIENNIFANDQY